MYDYSYVLGLLRTNAAGPGAPCPVGREAKDRAHGHGTHAQKPSRRHHSSCKAWMSFSATTTSPKPSAASDRLRPPGCAPVRAHGVEGNPPSTAERTRL